MRRTFRLMVILILLTGLFACSSSPETPTAEQPLDLIRCQITPALTHWLPEVQSCMNTKTVSSGLTVDIMPESDLTLEESDLIIKLGPKITNDPFVAVIGEETLIIVIGTEVPLRNISQADLVNIFTGQYQTWGELAAIPGDSPAATRPIQVFSFPPGHELHQTFTDRIMKGSTITTSAQVVNTLDTWKASIESSPYGISYIFESQITDSGIPSLAIEDDDPAARQVLVVAITPNEPSGNLKSLLLCLQNTR
jgi:hypothetical protein